MKKYRVVLIPKREYWEDFYNIVRRNLKKLNIEPKGNSLLHSIPHITMVKFWSSELPTEELWNSVKDIKDFTVTSEGLKCNFSKKFNSNLVAINIRRDSIIQKQSDMLKLIRDKVEKCDDSEFDTFKGHLSLFDTDCDSERILSDIKLDVFDKNEKMLFDVAIGLSNDTGEIVELIFE